MSELSDQLNLAFEQVKQMKDERENQNEIVSALTYVLNLFISVSLLFKVSG